MTKRMLLAGLLALTGVPAVASDVTSGRRTPASTDEARAVTAQQIAPKAPHAQLCSCKHGS